jgi:hypothetical protein
MVFMLLQTKLEQDWPIYIGLLLRTLGDANSNRFYHEAETKMRSKGLDSKGGKWSSFRFGEDSFGGLVSTGRWRQ